MPLKDSGNRTDYGTGALRDIGDGNGRCDLLPATAISDFLINEPTYRDPTCVNKPQLVTIFYLIMEYIGCKNTQWLYDALDVCLVVNWLKQHPDQTIAPKDKVLAQGMLDLSLHYRRGAEKYSERNWEKGLPIHSFIDSAIRHLCKEILGWEDEPHLIAIMWNLYGAIWTLQHFPELDDLPYNPVKPNFNTEGNYEAKKETVRVEESSSEKDSAEEANSGQVNLRDICDL